MSKLSVVVGGQFGSEGKGAIAAYLTKPETNGFPADSYENVIAVRVAGPNAGHTVIGKCPPDCAAQNIGTADPSAEESAIDSHMKAGGHPWRLRQIPVAAVTNPDAQLIIGAGSEVDPSVVQEEADALDRAGYNASSRLIIDNMATVIEQEHKDVERLMELNQRLGSTAKGIGAARSGRIMRTAHPVRQLAAGFLPGDRIDTARYLNSMLRETDNHVLIEGTQGWGLGLHTQYYPFCTSSNCRAIDFLSMAGVSPWLSSDVNLDVWVVFRTKPIRVAGNSGPLEGETTWRELGLAEEHTTVTQKVRRVGSWDPVLAREAVASNGGGIMNSASTVKVALTMADYEIPGIAGMDSGRGYSMDPSEQSRLERLLKEYEADLRAPIQLVGTSPSDVIDLR